MIGRCITKRHLGRDLDTISRGLRDKIPVNISEGKLRPEEPLQAAKLASEAGIILRTMSQSSLTGSIIRRTLPNLLLKTTMINLV